MRYPGEILLISMLLLSAFSISAASYEQLIAQQISSYRETYPEIEFILLRTNAEFDQLVPLIDSLGDALSNVDYEHPESARMMLVEAQEYRISYQLDAGNGTATLFRTPNARITDKSYTCLITLSLPLLDETDMAATRFMYDLKNDEINSFPESYRLDNRDFLAYSMDHEIFHCVDAHANGFLYPMTQDPAKACFDRNHVETRAEIFSAMAHLSRQPDGKKFLDNLAMARTLNLLHGDVEHYTSDVLSVLASRSEQYAGLAIKELVEKMMLMSDEMAADYAQYKEFLATLHVVIAGFGLNADVLLDECPATVDAVPLAKNVQVLRNKINNALSVIYPE